MHRSISAICLCLALTVVGCSSSGRKTGALEEVGGLGGNLPPEDYLPLLPRQSAAEQWESRRQPLPPLPEDYSRAAGSPETVDYGTEDSGDLEPPSVPTTSLKQVSPGDLGALVDSYKGKVLLLNCWGIDCGPCVEELPLLDKILRDLQPQGLAIVALNTDTESRYGDVEKFVQEKDYSLEFCLRAPGPDTKFRQAIDADYSADPFSVLFDKDGRTLATIADALSEEEWRRILTAAVQGNPLPITQSEYIRYF